MTKLRIALLEDNKQQLKERKTILEETGLVEVAVWAVNSDEFSQKMLATKVDALMLDIDLGGDSTNGVEIAFRFKLPTLFVSGHNAGYLKHIEELKREYDLIVDHITKPFSEHAFIKTVRSFVLAVKINNESKFLYLDFAESKGNKILIENMVFLCTNKGEGAESNNKQLFFTDRKAETLIDFSFSKMKDAGFDENKFITIHRSYRVNADKILRYLTDTHEVEVEVFKAKDKTAIMRLPVSENYQKDIRRLRK